MESVAMTKPEVTQSEGYLKVVLMEGKITPEAMAILKTFHQGALDLQESYPENIRLIHQVQ
jgi:uncharacterized protein YsxB (DUF464 family)